MISDVFAFYARSCTGFFTILLKTQVKTQLAFAIHYALGVSIMASSKKAFSLISDTALRQIYVTMLQCRLLAAYAGFAKAKGREAPFAAALIDARPGDAVFSVQRELAQYMTGSSLMLFAPRSPAPKGTVSPGLSSQITLATGLALAHVQKKDSSVLLAFLSGKEEVSSTAEEALRFAGTQKLPVLYIVNSLSEQGATASYGFPAIPVDVADAVAMYRVAHECTVRARQGQGPSMICCTPWIKKSDPVQNMERYLEAKGLHPDSWKQKTVSRFEQKLKQATSKGSSSIPKWPTLDLWRQKNS